jgi:hypothetical protein
LLAELCQWQKTQREMQPEAAVSALSMSL